MFECQDRTYVLATPNPNPGYCTYWTHLDLTILKHFAFDVLGLAVPDAVT